MSQNARSSLHGKHRVEPAWGLRGEGDLGVCLERRLSHPGIPGNAACQCTDGVLPGAGHTYGPAGVICTTAHGPGSFDAPILQMKKLRFRGWRDLATLPQADASYPINK